MRTSCQSTTARGSPRTPDRAIRRSSPAAQRRKPDCKSGDIITAVDGASGRRGRRPRRRAEPVQAGRRADARCACATARPCLISITLGTRPAGPRARSASAARSKRTPAWSRTPSIGHARLPHRHGDPLDPFVMGKHIPRNVFADRLEQVVAVILDLRPAQLEDLAVAHRLGKVVRRACGAQVELRARCRPRLPGDRALLVGHAVVPSNSMARRKIWSRHGVRRLVPAAADHGIGHARGASVWPHVVDANDVRAGGNAQRRRWRECPQRADRQADRAPCRSSTSGWCRAARACRASGAAARSWSTARFCSAVLPKPMPGSTIVASQASRPPSRDRARATDRR